MLHRTSAPGLSRLASPGGGQAAKNGLGTIAYTAPETFHDGVADMASDVYSFGILGRSLNVLRLSVER